jgi:Sec-independent protein translocase protein TatA
MRRTPWWAWLLFLLVAGLVVWATNKLPRPFLN